MGLSLTGSEMSFRAYGGPIEVPAAALLAARSRRYQRRPQIDFSPPDSRDFVPNRRRGHDPLNTIQYEGTTVTNYGAVGVSKKVNFRMVFFDHA